MPACHDPTPPRQENLDNLQILLNVKDYLPLPHLITQTRKEGGSWGLLTTVGQTTVGQAGTLTCHQLPGGGGGLMGWMGGDRCVWRGLGRAQTPVGCLWLGIIVLGMEIAHPHPPHYCDSPVHATPAVPFCQWSLDLWFIVLLPPIVTPPCIPNLFLLLPGTGQTFVLRSYLFIPVVGYCYCIIVVNPI